MKVVDALKRPSAAHPFGTDRFGRDVLSRTIYGSRIALGVAHVEHRPRLRGAARRWGWSAATSAAWPDLLIGRVMDVLFSFPTLILAIGIAAMLGPGLNNAALAIAVVYVPLFSRVARGPVIAEREKDYVGGGPGARRRLAPHRLPSHPAERPGAADRPGLGEPGLRHPHRGVAELSRARDPAARSLLGDDAQRGAHLPRDRALDEHLPGARDHARGVRLQPARATGCATRSTRSSAAGEPPPPWSISSCRCRGRAPDAR